MCSSDLRCREQPGAEAGIRQGEIMLQAQGTISPLKEGNGVGTVVGIAVDQPITFGIALIEVTGPFLGDGTRGTAADRLGSPLSRLPPRADRAA